MVAESVRSDNHATSAPLEDSETRWAHRHLLDVDVLSRDEIEQVLNTAQAMAEILERPVARTPALRGVTMFNLFYEASTRTRGSFELAGKVLGADVINLSGSGSSVEKGESLVNTLKTLSAVGADVVVMRHPASGAPYLAARTIAGHIINAGDGQHAHPTQALLDAYTILERKGAEVALLVTAVWFFLALRTVVGAQFELDHPENSFVAATGLLGWYLSIILF